MGADPATSSARGPKKLVSNWCQRRPIGPVLPVLPSSKCLSVNYLAFRSFHGMEEVIGSIPIRSTNSFQAFSRSPPKPFARILPQIAKSSRATALQSPFPLFLECQLRKIQFSSRFVQHAMTIVARIYRSARTSRKHKRRAEACPRPSFGIPLDIPSPNKKSVEQ